jgi:F0F1-type ATP synthase assembly protein I
VKLDKAAKTYTLATQGIFSIAAFTDLGFLIGWLINKESVWPVILAVLGLLIGLFSFVSYLLYLKKEDEKDKKKSQNKEPDDNGKEE